MNKKHVKIVKVLSEGDCAAVSVLTDVLISGARLTASEEETRMGCGTEGFTTMEGDTSWSWRKTTRTETKLGIYNNTD